jgi:hypothetical protein
MSDEIEVTNNQPQLEGRVATMEPIEAAPKKRGPKPGSKRTKPKAAAKPAPKVITKAPEINNIPPAGSHEDVSEQVKLAAPDAPKVLSETDQAYDFKDYNPNPVSSQEWPWAPGFDRTPVSVRLFRHDQMHELNGSVQCGYWVPVTINGAILGIPFTEMFVGSDDPAYPFDEYGFFPYGRVVTSTGGKKCREMYLAARPAAARDGEKRLRARLSADQLTQHNIVGQAAAERIQSQGAAQGQAASLHHPSANPNDPYAVPVQSSQSMGLNMITSERWAGLKNTK